MKIFRHTKQICASLLLPVVFLLVAFSTIERAETKTYSGKPAIHISQVAGITIREHTENAPVNPLRNPDALETNWQQSSLHLGSEASQHVALQVPAHVFNVFYSVITINAP